MPPINIVVEIFENSKDILAKNCCLTIFYLAIMCDKISYF